jgi:hypothetical protein
MLEMKLYPRIFTKDIFKKDEKEGHYRIVEEIRREYLWDWNICSGIHLPEGYPDHIFWTWETSQQGCNKILQESLKNVKRSMAVPLPRIVTSDL